MCRLFNVLAYVAQMTVQWVYDTSNSVNRRARMSKAWIWSVTRNACLNIATPSCFVLVSADDRSVFNETYEKQYFFISCHDYREWSTRGRHSPLQTLAPTVYWLNRWPSCVGLSIRCSLYLLMDCWWTFASSCATVKDIIRPCNDFSRMSVHWAPCNVTPNKSPT